MSETETSILHNKLVEGLLNMPIILFIALLLRGVTPYILLPVLLVLMAVLISSYRSLVTKVLSLGIKPVAFISTWLVSQALLILAVFAMA